MKKVFVVLLVAIMSCACFAQKAQIVDWSGKDAGVEAEPKWLPQLQKGKATTYCKTHGLPKQEAQNRTWRVFKTSATTLEEAIENSVIWAADGISGKMSTLISWCASKTQEEVFSMPRIIRNILATVDSSNIGLHDTFWQHSENGSYTFYAICAFTKEEYEKLIPKYIEAIEQSLELDETIKQNILLNKKDLIDYARADFFGDEKTSKEIFQRLALNGGWKTL